MIKASVLGATGYAGQELVRMLYQHEYVEIVGLGTQSYAGKPFSEIYPHFNGVVDTECLNIDDPALINAAEVIFLALPHGLSLPYVEAASKIGKKVIDLGADFRLKSPSVYTKWYKTTGPSLELLKQAVYGLPEVYRQDIKEANIIANPGCYPTTAILALAPLLKNKLIDTNYIIIDSKSGVSGAGRSLVVNSLFSEVDGDLKAYGIPQHRHTPEIEQELTLLAENDVMVTFTPHLIPMIRGMMSTVYTRPNQNVTQIEIEEAYQNFYSNEPFIRILPQGQYPHTKWVLGTNYCDIGLSWDERTGRLRIISAIDNLVKGASGQAVQNMNIMYGLNENLGLARIAMYP
ncbi:MAG: N-acetyl-gamma-glutamyl-phosphate reductase [Firmicutes bacterium HGW-Firmicutes-12]|nr:MAG: N-acetyl-gamma-glutamyl-phosphate reductase [Firmicutes bacterium HGW-Firmicutes-12]